MQGDRSRRASTAALPFAAVLALYTSDRSAEVPRVVEKIAVAPNPAEEAEDSVAPPLLGGLWG